MERRSLKFAADAMQGELLAGSPDQFVSGVCTDSRQAMAGDLFFALSGERFDAHAFLGQVIDRGASTIVGEKAKVPGQLGKCGYIGVENVRRALGLFAGAYRRSFSLPVVAVGGSNGKTSTKELIASVLRQERKTVWSEASFNNDVGVPLTLLKVDSSHQAAVVEAGTNHPGELAPLLQQISPQFGVITNVGREHLEFFGDLAGVAQEEGAMAECLPKGGRLFLNGDCPWSNSFANRTRAVVLRAGLGSKNDYVAERIRFDENGVRFAVRTPYQHVNGEYHIQLLGRHHVLNALFALAVGAELGVSSEAVARGLAQCLPAKMRLQLSVWNGVRILDDSYNANADSMLAGLQTLCELPCTGRRIAVLGDMAELGAGSSAAHIDVGRRAAELKLDFLFTIGSRMAQTATEARARGLAAVQEFSEVEGAAQALKKTAKAGDLVLIKASRSMRLERVRETLQCGDGVG